MTVIDKKEYKVTIDRGNGREKARFQEYGKKIREMKKKEGKR